MIGVYQIKNIINNKIYIGCSKNISKRWREHQRDAFDPDRHNYESHLYRAIRKYGLENFIFEIIELTDEDKIFEREIHYIDFYNSYYEGYNDSLGGEGNSIGQLKEEEHPNAKLTLEEVKDIRTRYNNLERKKEVYELYKDKINSTGFDKVWNFQTWKEIMPEVHSEENRKFHSSNKSMAGSTNGRAKLIEKDIYDIRIRKKNGEMRSKVYLDYQHTGLTLAGFKNIWYYRSWKHIIVE